MRLDKFLFCARIYKSRTRAALAVSGGKVRVNAQRVKKPAKEIGVDDVITVTRKPNILVLRVISLPCTRVAASLVENLYEELSTKP